MAAIANIFTRPVARPGRGQSGGARVAGMPPSRAETRGSGQPWMRLVAVGLAALLVLPVAEGTQTAEAGKKNELVTKTFSSNGQIAIPEVGNDGPANPYPSTIKVTAFKKFKKARIKDVDLTLRGFSHDVPQNVDVMLVLGNRQAVVMSDVGQNDDANDLTLDLDDEAADALPANDTLESGTFRPTNAVGADGFTAPAPAAGPNVALSTFNNAKPDGTWRLFIFDDAGGGGTGDLAKGWELEITAKVKEKKDKGGKNKDKNKDED